jgi:TPR repeat protein
VTPCDRKVAGKKINKMKISACYLESLAYSEGMSNTTTTTSAHFMLTAKPGDLFVACYALQSMSSHAYIMGRPISKAQAREWLSSATDTLGWWKKDREQWIETKLEGTDCLI